MLFARILKTQTTNCTFVCFSNTDVYIMVSDSVPYLTAGSSEVQPSDTAQAQVQADSDNPDSGNGQSITSGKLKHILNGDWNVIFLDLHEYIYKV